MYIATCTPVDFESNEHFFSRDTGLLCRGFQQAGINCIVVMPGEAKPCDPPDLLRCKESDLYDQLWWKSRNLDIIVLYAWGDPKYRGIARAIRDAGILLIQSLDTAGLPSPYADFKTWLQSSWGSISLPQSMSKRLRMIARILRDFVPSIFESKRIAMIQDSDFVAAVSPPALESVAAYATALDHEQVRKKLILGPHPVSPLMKYRGNLKERRVIVVGRWLKSDESQKDPRLTMKVLSIFLKEHPNWCVDVIGRGSKRLENYKQNWDRGISNRLSLHDFLPHDQLIECYSRSQILLCASRFESFHIASAEALCCGCSVVVGKHPLLASTSWFTTCSSGTLSPNRNSYQLANALRNEALEWERGNRCPEFISTHWSNILHAPNVARFLAKRASLKCE